MYTTAENICFCKHHYLHWRNSLLHAKSSRVPETEDEVVLHNLFLTTPAEYHNFYSKSTSSTQPPLLQKKGGEILKLP